MVAKVNAKQLVEAKSYQIGDTLVVVDPFSLYKAGDLFTVVDDNLEYPLTVVDDNLEYPPFDLNVYGGGYRIRCVGGVCIDGLVVIHGSEPGFRLATKQDILAAAKKTLGE